MLFLILLAGGVLWFTLNGMPYINNLRANWEAQRLQDQWEKPYREDKYGGETPEETYDMFLSALSKGDITLASKYFMVDEQSKWEKTFEEYKNQNLLGDLMMELKNNQKSWTLSKIDNQTIIYTYSYIRKTPQETELPISGGKIQRITLPAGTFKAETIFELNTYTKVWKISVL
mgnify:FL=1